MLTGIQHRSLFPSVTYWSCSAFRCSQANSNIQSIREVRLDVTFLKYLGSAN